MLKIIIYICTRLDIRVCIKEKGGKNKVGGKSSSSPFQTEGDLRRR